MPEIEPEFVNVLASITAVLVKLPAIETLFWVIFPLLVPPFCIFKLPLSPVITPVFVKLSLAVIVPELV